MSSRRLLVTGLAIGARFAPTLEVTSRGGALCWAARAYTTVRRRRFA
jgi:hypothetical protein